MKEFNKNQCFASGFRIISKNKKLYFEQETDLFGIILEQLHKNGKYYVMESKLHEFKIRLQLMGKSLQKEIKFNEQKTWLDQVVARREVDLTSFFFFSDLGCPTFSSHSPMKQDFFAF